MSKRKERYTYSKSAKSSYLTVSLTDLGINDRSNYGLGPATRYNDIFTKLVVFTPSKQSHLGVKFNEYPRLNNATTDKFLKSIFDGLKLKQVLLFDSHTSSSGKKSNLKEQVTACNEAMLVMRCDAGVKESLFSGIRNAIAHGNIIYDGNYYSFYSVGSDAEEYTSPVTFFLRIDNISKLKKLFATLDAYK